MKNQLKKSLSLIMAVLMILSCWVWVAPEKASAGSDTYYVTLTYDVNNAAEGGGHCSIWYYPFNDNGTLNTSSMVPFDLTGTEFNSMFGSGGTGLESTTDGIPGWPCKLQITVNGKSGNDYDVVLKKVTINGIDVLATSTGWTFADDWYHDSSTTKTFQWDGKGGDEGSASTANWKKPTFTSLTEMSATDVNVVKYPSTSVSTSTVTVTGGLDQYGVPYKATKPGTGYTHTLKYTTNLGDMVSLDSKYARITSASGANPVTVTVYPEIQKLFENTAFTEIYLESYYNSDTKSVIQTPIKLYFPGYSAYFYPNGGAIGTSKTNNTSDDAKPLEYGNILYGAFIKQLPKYADRSSEGLELDG